MKEHPLLFTAEMVRAILDGGKTQTRRIVSPKNSICHTLLTGDGQGWHSFDFNDVVVYGKRGSGDRWYLKVAVPENETRHRILPRVEPGDLLWVKESFKIQQINEVYSDHAESHVCLDFPASEGRPTTELRHWFKMRSEDRPRVLRRRHPDKVFLSPSIFLPKSCARLWLQVERVRAERLQDISEADAKAEGTTLIEGVGRDIGRQWAFSYAILWSKINAGDDFMHPHHWNQNPWVWVYEFQLISTTGRPTQKQLENIPQKSEKIFQ